MRKLTLIAVMSVTILCCQPSAMAAGAGANSASTTQQTSRADWDKVGRSFQQAGSDLLSASTVWLQEFVQKTHKYMDSGMNGLQRWLGGSKQESASTTNRSSMLVPAKNSLPNRSKRLAAVPRERLMPGSTTGSLPVTTTCRL